MRNHGRNFTPSADRMIIRLYKEGKKYREIAERMERTLDSVRHRGKRLGLTKARPEGRKRAKKPNPLPQRKCLKTGEWFTPSHRFEFQSPEWKRSKVYQSSGSAFA